MHHQTIQNDVLAALLTIVTNPDAVAKNIRALQDSIASHEVAVQKALDAQSAAEASRKALDAANATIGQRETELKARSAMLDQREDQIGNRHAALSGRENAHVTQGNLLEGREKALDEREANLNKAAAVAEQSASLRQGNLDKAYDELKAREAGLDAREAALTDAEAKAQATIAEYAAKLDTLRGLVQ